MQKAIIVKAEPQSKGLEELNDKISRGWKVVSSCPMPSNGKAHFNPTCLVIVTDTFTFPG
jgi:hypothetical protein